MNSKRLARKMAKICVFMEKYGVKVTGEFYINEDCQIKEFSARSADKTGCGFVWVENE